MCSDFVTAGALGGIQGTLSRMAREQGRQNNMAGALAQQTQVANHWQVTAFKLQNERSEWKALSRRTLEALEKEEQVTADLRQQLAQAQEALRVEKDRGWEELNELNERYNKLVRKSNRFLKCINTIKGQPADAIALITALEAEMRAQQA